MTSKFMKKCSTSLEVDAKEMHIKTTLRFHVTPVRMAITKGSNKCWRGCGNTGTPYTAGRSAN
jgi:hypothetical protein